MLDLIIIGAGPTGIALGIEAKKAGLDYLIVDKGAWVDTIRRYPTYTTFFSTADLLEIDGHPFSAIAKQPTRQEALNYYGRLAHNQQLNAKLGCEVESISGQDGSFVVKTISGPIQARKVVLAIGYYDQYNALGIEGEELRHVSHYYKEAYAYAGRDVVVVGGSNSAAEAVLDLYRHGARATLVHRSAELRPGIKYWLRPDLVNRIKEGSIPAYFNTALTRIEPGMVHLSNEEGAHTVAADAVFLLTGYHPNAAWLKGLGIEINQESLEPTFNPETFESNQLGLYLAGTVTCGKHTSRIFIENARHHAKQIIPHIAKSLA